jgi:hypothetical protein
VRFRDKKVVGVFVRFRAASDDLSRYQLINVNIFSFAYGRNYEKNYQSFFW